MKKLIIATLITSVLFGNSFAKTDKKESIKQLFVLMKQDSLMNKTFDYAPLAVNGPFTAQLKDSTKLTQSLDAIKKTKQIMSEIYPKIQADMIDYYDRHFTQAEINDFIRFYKSASGQKMINTTPLIMKEMMSSFQSKYMKDLIVELVKMNINPENINIRKPTLKPDSAFMAQMRTEYLDVETTNLQTMTDEQKLILKKAKERTERYVSFENNQYVLNVTKATDLNMSERLFVFMKNTIKQSNQFMETLRKP